VQTQPSMSAQLGKRVGHDRRPDRNLHRHNIHHSCRHYSWVILGNRKRSRFSAEQSRNFQRHGVRECYKFSQTDLAAHICDGRAGHNLRVEFEHR